MAKERGSETIVEKAVKYCLAHQFPEVVLREKLTLVLYGNTNPASQDKLPTVMSKMEKSIRQDHPDWGVYISSIVGFRNKILSWVVTDNPHDGILNLAKAKTLAMSFTDRITEDLERVDVRKLKGEELKEWMYKLKAAQDMAVKWMEEFTNTYGKVVSFMPEEELKRRKELGMGIPKELEEGIGEITTEEQKKIGEEKSEKVDKTQTKEPSGKTKEKAKTYKFICKEHNIKTNNRISWNLHIRAKHPDMQEVK